MTALRLERVAAIGDLCLLGRLSTAAGAPLQKTLELPWRDNAIGKSCIPAGCYTIRPRETKRRGRHFTFDDSETNPRTAILIHTGNVAADVIGCVLVGLTFGVLLHQPAVLHSRRALNDLCTAYPDGFTLQVEGYG